MNLNSPEFIEDQNSKLVRMMLSCTHSNHYTTIPTSGIRINNGSNPSSGGSGSGSFDWGHTNGRGGRGRCDSGCGGGSGSIGDDCSLGGLESGGYGSDGHLRVMEWQC